MEECRFFVGAVKGEVDPRGRCPQAHRDATQVAGCVRQSIEGGNRPHYRTKTEERRVGRDAGE